MYSDKKNALFISGGGTKGVYALGIIKYMMTNTDIFDLEMADLFGGTSVGSFFATALAIGFNYSDTLKMIDMIDLTQIFDNSCFYMKCVYKISRYGYAYENEKLVELIKNIINLRLDDINTDLGINLKADDVTFGHLKNLRDRYPKKYRNLLINTVDISSGEEVFFTTLNDLSDNFLLMDAMIASSSVPMLFKPFPMYRYPDGSYGHVETALSEPIIFVDGGISMNNTLDFFLVNEHLPQFADYNVWLIQFTMEKPYVRVDTNIAFITRLCEYMIIGKNNTKVRSLRDTFTIKTMNLDLKTGMFDVYTQKEITRIINKIVKKCETKQLSFVTNELD